MLQESDSIVTWAHGAVVVNTGALLYAAFWMGRVNTSMKAMGEDLKALRALVDSMLLGHNKREV